MEKLTLSKTDSLPITVDEAKLWCRIDSTAEDFLVSGLIAAATEAAEAETNRTLRASQIEYSFPHNRRTYVLPTSPVRTIVKAEIEDCQGNRTLLTQGTDYLVTFNDRGAVVRLQVFSSTLGRVIITADVGYDDPEFIPQSVKQAIAVHVGSAYSGREGQDTASATFRALLGPLRVGLI